jgi:hypothetical protein
MAKSKNNLAKLLYQAYPHSDLLPIDPEIDCRDWNTLFQKVTTGEIGDSLFRFLVVEIREGGEGTRKGAMRVLLQARQDIEAVLQAFGHRPKAYSRLWRCPQCSCQVNCSYEQLAEVGVPMCPDCDVEMDLV